MAERLGPGDGSLIVRTFREGVAARAGHDLVIEVTRWEATLGDDAVELTVDPRSLEIREGVGGVKPLTDGDRAEIRKNIDTKVLGGQPIAFRSTSLERTGGRLAVTGELTLAGTTKPLSASLAVEGGRITGTVRLNQTTWGIKPYRGLMGALKVRDDVEVEIDIRA
jgi:polyisoprenoid-binding protein YceI